MLVVGLFETATNSRIGRSLGRLIPPTEGVLTAFWDLGAAYNKSSVARTFFVSLNIITFLYKRFRCRLPLINGDAYLRMLSGRSLKFKTGRQNLQPRGSDCMEHDIWHKQKSRLGKSLQVMRFRLQVSKMVFKRHSYKCLTSRFSCVRVLFSF